MFIRSNPNRSAQVFATHASHTSFSPSRSMPPALETALSLASGLAGTKTCRRIPFDLLTHVRRHPFICGFASYIKNVTVRCSLRTFPKTVLVAEDDPNDVHLFELAAQHLPPGELRFEVV